MRARAVVVFRGRVQGVYFRANCADKAEELGLDGYVRNMHDGTVEAVFEGDKSLIETCIDWNRKSQPYARVEAVEGNWSEPRGDVRGFQIHRRLSSRGYRNSIRYFVLGRAWGVVHTATPGHRPFA